MSPWRDRLQRLAFRASLLTERLGVQTVPRHYYSPVADRAWLRRHETVWRRPSPLPGVELDIGAQLAWTAATVGPYRAELPAADPRGLAGFGPGYGLVEGWFLHAFVRAHAPARVVEVGSGVSTALMAQAAARNVAEGRRATAIVCVDPYAPDAVASLDGVTVVRESAQSVDAAVFDGLGAGDLLFIDSTHALRTGSELARLYLEVVPALAAGTFVHVHDVFLPYLYGPEVLDTWWDWQETALVAALLTGNARLEILACQSAMHHAKPHDLAALFPPYEPRPFDRGIAAASRGEFPASLWLRTR